MLKTPRYALRFLNTTPFLRTNCVRRYNFLAMAPQNSETQTGGQGNKKRQFQGGGGRKKGLKKTKKQQSALREGTSEEVLLEDVRALFASQKLSEHTLVKPELGLELEDTKEDTVMDDAPAQTGGKLPDKFAEIEVEVLELSSTGDGLAVHASSNQIYVVPFSTPGDIIKAKVIRHVQEEHYSFADFVSVVKPGPLRDDTRINCQYFTTCSGCQFQMLDYAAQLKHKRSIVEKAYKNFSDLPPELIPIIEDTTGSPLQYGYRTKLTPHFDGPPGYLSKADKRNGERKYFTEVPSIGFMVKNQRRTLDIEDCPIGTDAVRMGNKRERLQVVKDLQKYKKGATILLRESTERVANSDEKAATTIPETIKVVSENYTDFKSCITDNNGTSTEYIGDFIFTNIAGSFFQNNNSILPIFTQYIRDNILPPPSESGPQIKYLIDAYSGSGLFTITLSSLFTQSTGIDISVASISSAGQNAELNKLPPSQCTFIAADAGELFKSVTYPKEETVVVLDPPRKGCDESFLSQLLSFGPKRIVYVSCNVHTQARDIGIMVRGMAHTSTKYKIESLRGWDFFPQTSHVEGVAVLSLIDELVPEVIKSEDIKMENSKIEEAISGDIKSEDIKSADTTSEKLKTESLSEDVKDESIRSETIKSEEGH